jgi:hypothetical protein
MNQSVEPGGTRIGRYLRDHPHLLERLYRATLGVTQAADPLLKRIGYERAEKLLHWPEELTKQAVFDCRMCGQCVLHSTGMTCPMSCPKNLRNGPCGGVRANGNCEVVPEMKCVWVEAYERSQKMPIYGHEIMKLQPPVNRQLEGDSAWVNMLTGVDQKQPAGWIAMQDISVNS